MNADDELLVDSETEDAADAVDGLDDDSELDGGVIPDDYDELDDEDDDDDLDDDDDDDEDDDGEADAPR